MARKKKSGNKDKALQTILFATAILQLLRALVEFIDRLTS